MEIKSHSGHNLSKDSRNRIRAVVRLRPVIKEDGRLAKLIRLAPEVEKTLSDLSFVFIFVVTENIN